MVLQKHMQIACLNSKFLTSTMLVCRKVICASKFETDIKRHVARNSKQVIKFTWPKYISLFLITTTVLRDMGNLSILITLVMVGTLLLVVSKLYHNTSIPKNYYYNT